MPLKPTAPSAAAAVEPRVPLIERLAARTDVPLPEVLRVICEHAAESLCVERTGVWLFVNGERILRCVSLFERSKRRHSKGASLSLAQPSAYLQAVATTPLLACEQARSDPRTAELDDAYLAPNGITSLLDAPLLRDDRLIGVVAHEHVGPPREWTDDERDFARSIADLVVAKMRIAASSLRTAQWHVAVPNPGRAAQDCDSHPEISREMAHDLRNSLNDILSNANLLGLIPNLPSGAASRLEKIRLAVDRAMARLGSTDDSASNSSDDTGEHEPLPQSSR